MYDVCNEILTNQKIVSIEPGEVTLQHIWTDPRRTLSTGTLVLVTARLPNDHLYQDLVSDPDALLNAGIKSVDRIGDCVAPQLIAAAVYSGHRYARGLDVPRAVAAHLR
jgi:dimethylamine/trimethylamine dehydrogenase